MIPAGAAKHKVRRSRDVTLRKRIEDLASVQKRVTVRRRPFARWDPFRNDVSAKSGYCILCSDISVQPILALTGSCV